MAESQEPAETRPTTGKLPVRTKLTWGVGGFGENIANAAILSLVYPIFNVALGFSTLAIGLAMAISRIADAFLDPIIGNLTDNTVSRWGRRRPWMFVGSILMALFFSAIWFLPTLMPQLPKMVTVHVSDINQAETSAQNQKPALHDSLSWYTVSTRDITLSPGSAIARFNVMLRSAPESTTAFSIQPIASEDTAVQISINPTQLNFTANNWQKPQTVTITANGTAETSVLRILPGTDILDSPFLHQFGITSYSSLQMFIAFALLCILFYFSFSVFAVFMGLFFSLPFMTYIGIYYCCQGDKMLAAEIGGVMTIIQVAGQFLAMPLIAWASERVDKKAILFTGLSISIVGYASSWWLFTPENPWLQIIPVVVAAWGLCACWAVNGSFAADICDEDELNTGHRREGVYSAVFALVYKTAIGIEFANKPRANAAFGENPLNVGANLVKKEKPQ